MNVKRPLLRYFGGKWRIRNWIVNHFQDHDYYAEPFSGAASILLSKPRANKAEIINDLNHELINLFSVIRDPMLLEQFKHRLAFTLFSRDELDLAMEPTVDPVEKAARLVVKSFMGVQTSGNRRKKTGFRMANVSLDRLDQDGKMTFRNCARDWRNWQDSIEAIANRFRGVMVYSRDAIEFIREMNHPDCLIYVDPPYVDHTRTSHHKYLHDFTKEQHQDLVEALLESKSQIVLSGYPNELYEQLDKRGWRRVEKQVSANMSRVRRTECLWLSRPEIVDPQVDLIAV